MSTHSAEKRVPGKVGAWRWVVLVAGAVLAAVFVFSIVLAVVAAIQAAGKPNWMERTGPIGDTFGGLLSPILSTAALVTTAYLAVWQPRKERAEERASAVVAWIAERDDDREKRGVVISNTSGSVVQNVDIIVISQDDSAEPAREALRDRNPGEGIFDREDRVPPGTWFIPYDMKARNWKLPVAVDSVDGMTVRLAAPDEGELAGEGGLNVVSLRTHLPEEEEGGESLPHDLLAEFRFELHGTAWGRNDVGRIVKDLPELGPEDEEKLEAARRTRRESAQKRSMSSRVREDVETLVRYTVEAVCTRADDSSERDVFALAKTEPQKVDPLILPHVKTVFRSPNGGSRLDFELDNGWKLVVAQSHNRERDVTLFPAVLHVTGADLPKQIVSRVGGAGAKVIAKKNSGELREQPAAFWVRSSGSKALWLMTLREMVVEAMTAWNETKSDLTANGSVASKGIDNEF